MVVSKFVFLVDTTGSMREYLTAMLAQLPEVLQMCKMLGVDVGVMAYSDYDKKEVNTNQL